MTAELPCLFDSHLIAFPKSTKVGQLILQMGFAKLMAFVVFGWFKLNAEV